MKYASLVVLCIVAFFGAIFLDPKVDCEKYSESGVCKVQAYFYFPECDEEKIVVTWNKNGCPGNGPMDMKRSPKCSIHDMFHKTTNVDEIKMKENQCNLDYIKK